MPVQIGAKAHHFSDPTGLLTDCHRRIETFMGSLEAVGKVMDAAPSNDTRQALEGALRYFREAAPKHTADEDESRFPRLRGLHSPEVEAAFSKRAELEGAHRWAEGLPAAVERLGLQYLAMGGISSAEAEIFRKHVAELFAMYRRHIAVEDKELFPLAAGVLPAEDKRAIAEEMAGRRKVPLVNLG